MCRWQRDVYLPKKKELFVVHEPDPRLSLTSIEIEELLKGESKVQKHASVKVISSRGRHWRSVPIPLGSPIRDIAFNATIKAAIQRQATFCCYNPSNQTREMRAKGNQQSSNESGLTAEKPDAIVPIQEQSQSIEHHNTTSRLSCINSDFRLNIRREDYRRKERRRACGHLIVFIVDTSESMDDGAAVRMKAAKGAVLALLRRAYQNRSQIVLIAFGGEEAKIILNPTRSIQHAQQRLCQLPSGGATPFADGLYKGWQMIKQQRLKDKGLLPVMVIISDGEANVPLNPENRTIPELFQLAHAIQKDSIHSVLIDVVTEIKKRIEMQELAKALGAAYIKVSDLQSRHILRAMSQSNFL